MSLSTLRTDLSPTPSSQSSSSSYSTTRTTRKQPDEQHQQTRLETVLPAPPDIAVLRRQYFNILQTPGKGIGYSAWLQLEPFLENVYRKDKDRVQMGPEGPIGRIYYSCRWSKKEYTTPVELGKRKRDGATQNKCDKCPVNSLVAVVTAGWVTFEVPKLSPETWPVHNHTLEWCDGKKINKAVRDAMCTEIEKGYPASYVQKLFNGEWQDGNRVHLQACGGMHLSGKLGNNVARDFLKANRNQRRKGALEDWQAQVDDAMRYLDTQEDWIYRQISAIRAHDGEISNALVFGSRDRIQTLCQRGKLTLLDSTHCTNKLGWFLFTLVVRDEQGSFIPCAHFLSSNEDGDIIGASLRVIREWTGGLEGWKLAYILTDDSAAEQRGVRLAFDDVESQVRHLLCTKHSGATLDRNLAGNSKKEARLHMKDAMYVRRSRLGAADSVQKAIDSLPSKNDKDYLRNNWLNSIDSWAMCARTQCCLLLQVIPFSLFASPY